RKIYDYIFHQILSKKHILRGEKNELWCGTSEPSRFPNFYGSIN
ncbi:unnamed protein product, partial [Arabidopsis halleri]